MRRLCYAYSSWFVRLPHSSVSAYAGEKMPDEEKALAERGINARTKAMEAATVCAT